MTTHLTARRAIAAAALIFAGTFAQPAHANETTSLADANQEPYCQMGEPPDWPGEPPYSGNDCNGDTRLADDVDDRNRREEPAPQQEQDDEQEQEQDEEQDEPSVAETQSAPPQDDSPSPPPHSPPPPHDGHKPPKDDKPHDGHDKPHDDHRSKDKK